MAKSWQLTIKPPITGFSPAWWKNAYPSFGDKNMLGDMQNLDISDPTVITQGPGLANLTNGTQAGAVTTLLKHILPIPLEANITYGIGGNLLYKMTASGVTVAAWPHTIDKAAVTAELGESVCSYGSNLLYFYNHSGSAGDIGLYNGSTFDDDWGSTVPTGAAVLEDAPHPSVLGGDGLVYFGNGPYVGYYDPVTGVISVDELDLPEGSEVVDIKWQNSALYIAVNYPNLSGSNANIGILYVWDTVAKAWNDAPNPKVMGTIGALYIKNGVVYVWYQDLSSTGGFKIGHMRGNQIIELENFTGSLPNFGQVCEYNNLLAWVSSGEIWTFGSSGVKTPAVLSQLADGGYSTVGALAVPFGTPLVASYETTSFRLAKFSGYTVSSTFKSLAFDVAMAEIKTIDVYFETLATGARCDLTLKYDRNVSSLALVRAGETGSINFANDGARTRKTYKINQKIEDFRIEGTFANGSATNPVKIRKIRINGIFSDKE